MIVFATPAFTMDPVEDKKSYSAIRSPPPSGCTPRPILSCSCHHFPNRTMPLVGAFVLILV